jgi:hypothetical protein
MATDSLKANFIHHRHEAGGIDKRLPFAATDPVRLNSYIE